MSKKLNHFNLYNPSCLKDFGIIKKGKESRVKGIHVVFYPSHIVLLLV